MTSIFAYACLWLSFGFGHSLLTVSSVKHRLEPFFGSAYRLSYNVFAAVHIGLVLLLGRYLLSGSQFALLSSAFVNIISTLVTFSGVVLIMLSLRQYNLGQFSGLSQLHSRKSNNGTTELEELNVKGLNSWVRHPLYSGAFLYLWGSAVSPLGVWTALFASVYLLIGAHYEERKLISVYGDDYQAYKKRVPAFFALRKSA